MASRFWVGGTGTWDSSTTTHWSASTGGAGGATAPVNGDAVTFDGSSGGGTVTADATISGLSFASITAGAFTGTLTFAVNNPSLTITGSFSVSGAGTRTINLGTGTFTINGVNNPWDCTTTTGLTASFASATFTLNTSAAFAGQAAFNTGGQTYGTVNLIGTSANGNAYTINNTGSTIATLNVTAPVTVCFSSSTTITNAVAWTGTSANQILITNPISNGATNVTLTAAGGTVTWATLRGVTFVTNSLTATNSFSFGGVTNATITNPSTGSGSVIGS